MAVVVATVGDMTTRASLCFLPFLFLLSLTSSCRLGHAARELREAAKSLPDAADKIDPLGTKELFGAYVDMAEKAKAADYEYAAFFQAPARADNPPEGARFRLANLDEAPAFYKVWLSAHPDFSEDPLGADAITPGRTLAMGRIHGFLDVTQAGIESAFDEFGSNFADNKHLWLHIVAFGGGKAALTKSKLQLFEAIGGNWQPVATRMVNPGEPYTYVKLKADLHEPWLAPGDPGFSSGNLGGAWAVAVLPFELRRKVLR